MFSSRGGKSDIFSGIKGCSLRGEASLAFFSGIKGCSLRREASLAFFTSIKGCSLPGEASLAFFTGIKGCSLRHPRYIVLEMVTPSVSTSYTLILHLLLV